MTQILTHLNLGDNVIKYEGSRYLAQALKVNSSLRVVNLKLNRIDDKGGSKLCIDLMNNNNTIQDINLSSNSLGHMFAESLAELLKINKSIRKIDISCNFITANNAATLRDSLENNENVISIDIRGNNDLGDENEEMIHEIVTKNYLKSQKIPYSKKKAEKVI